MDWSLLYSRDFWRGMFVGLLTISMILILVRTVADSGIIGRLRDTFALWRARKADFDSVINEIVELKNTNVELREQIDNLSSMNLQYESTCESYESRYDQLEKSKRFQAHMIERLADHCNSLDPQTGKKQFLVSARTYAENKMEENGG